jgi:hypothetical protein
LEKTIDSTTLEAGRNQQLSGLGAEQQLHSYICDMCLDEIILDYLLPNGKPRDYETSLWDYKRQLPNTSGRGDVTEQQTSAAAIAELVKDIVAFYNSYGGYIIAGVDQFAKEPIVGCSNLNVDGFTVDKLNEQLKSYTKARIDCRFARFPVRTASGEKEIGILAVPMRPANRSVMRMARGAPEVNKKSSFPKNAVFARVGDTCVPLTEDAQLLQFLCSSRMLGSSPRNIEHNLPPPDPNLIRFVGRSEYLFKLWDWMIDRHTAVKTLTALGGTGKTAIAYEFCRQFLEDAPSWATKVIWLSAKKRAFSAILGRYENATRTDFSTPTNFLEALARECGVMDAEIATAQQEQGELLDLVYEGLNTFPSLVVVDDIDSLPIEEQNNLFATIQQLAGRLHETGTRFLFTSRLELGADSQRIPVKGFEEGEFSEYAKMVAKERSVPLNDAVLQNLYRASKGSPIFCSSVIRLAMLGADINKAIKDWKGRDGEEVRRFAFERELKELTDSQTRTLFALCTLGETTHVELKQVLEADEHVLNSDLARLREFHLYASGGDPRTGARLEVPEPILLMRDILSQRVQDPRRLAEECAKLRSKSPRVNDRVAVAIGSVIALWKENDYDGAELTARQAVKDNKKSGDLYCILGQCQLKLTPPRPEEADKLLAEARRLECTRTELLSTWLEAKSMLRDWMGIVDVVGKSLPRDVRSHVAFHYVRALAELGRQAFDRNDPVKAIERFKQAMQAASRTIGQGQAGECFAALRELCRACAQNYVRIVDVNSRNTADRLDVFNAVDDAFNCHVTESRLLALGLNALRIWSDNAISRASTDSEPIRILERRLERLNTIRQHIEQQGPQRAELAAQIADVHNQLLNKCRAASRNDA